MGRKNPHYRIVISLLITAFCTLGNAQVDSVVYSPLMKFGKNDFSCSIVSSEDFLLTVKQDNQPNEVQFSIFEKESLNLINEFKWSKKGKEYIDLEIKIVEYFDGQILLLSSSISSDKQSRFLWLTSLSPDGAEIKHLKLIETKNNHRNSIFTYELFKDLRDSHVGISMVLEQEKEFVINVFLLDLTLKIIKEKEIKLDNIKKVNYPHSFHLSDRGFIFFLNGLAEEKNANQSEVGLENRLYQLYRYDPLNDKIKQYDVTIADKFISDVKMKLSSEGDLYVTGFYNKSINKGAEGIFLMVIDKEDGSLLVSGKRALDEKIISDFLTEKQIKRAKVIEDLYLDHIYIDDSGNIILLAEIFFIEQRVVTSPNGIDINSSYFYNWGDILTLELDRNLNYITHETIKKKQKSTNYLSPFWSYTLIEKDDKSKAIVYNYVTKRRSGGLITATSPARAVTWYHPLFTNDFSKLETPKGLSIAPLFSPIYYGPFGVLQDKRDFSLLKIVRSSN